MSGCSAFAESGALQSPASVVSQFLPSVLLWFALCIQAPKCWVYIFLIVTSPQAIAHFFIICFSSVSTTL